MPEFLIAIAAFLASGLTLFSGFGLGTILLPVFALFFPLDLSVALTAIVHFLNNVFKFLLLGKQADRGIVIQFGIPSLVAAVAGAFLLNVLSDLPVLAEYTLFGKSFELLPVKIIIALLLIAFALFDLVPKLHKLEIDRKYLPIGGLLSGFFGGFSGHQGALRSAFLIRAKLSKESFIATGIVIACLVDISRMAVYSKQILKAGDQIDWVLTGIAVLSAFAGAFFGSRMIKKVTIKALQYTVAIALILFSVFMGLGMI